VNNDELLDICHQIAARLKVVEDAIAANVRKNVAPTPASNEGPECPPEMEWNEAAGKCVEVQPAPAVQKTVERIRIQKELAKERTQRGLSAI